MGFKWLCLHGAGCNKEIFQSQMAAFTYLLRNNHGDEFVWLEGKVAARETDTIDVNGATDGPFLQWWDVGKVQELKHDAKKAKDFLKSSVDQAHQVVRETFARHGPFDGILAHSQGGSLIGDILIRHVLQPDLEPLQKEPLKAVVLFGSPPPPDVWTEGENIEAPVSEERVGSVVDTPAIFVLGDNDVWYNDVLSFKGCWKKDAARLIEYQGLHTLPADVSVYKQVMETVSDLRA